ncbi:PIN domain-containing protein [bacterium]|nr:PIN domain-containing protein [bacterium]
MPDSGILWVLDTSILVSYLRSGRYTEFIARGLRNRSIFLPGIVLCELYAGAVTRRDRNDLEVFRRAIGPHVLPSEIEDSVLAGHCLAHYSARWGKIVPRDHIADILIAVSAARLKAYLATQNVSDMFRWKWVLKKLRWTLRIGRLPKIEKG